MLDKSEGQTGNESFKELAEQWHLIVSEITAEIDDESYPD